MHACKTALLISLVASLASCDQALGQYFEVPPKSFSGPLSLPASQLRETGGWASLISAANLAKGRLLACLVQKDMTWEQVTAIMGKPDGFAGGFGGWHHFYDNYQVTISFGSPVTDSANKVVDVYFWRKEPGP